MSTQSAYDQGFQSYIEGSDLSANPFQEPSDDFYDWEGGWVAASDQDAEATS